MKTARLNAAYHQASLRLWQGRVRRYSKRLAAAHAAHNPLLSKKWDRLLEEARANVAMRRRKLAALKPTLSPARARVVAAAEQAAANYRRNPRAYHYLAGGIANTEILRPTPRSWRSDCSQFAVNVYRVAGVPCPGNGTYLHSNTNTISQGGRITTNPKPGDLGMYGPGRGRTHHVEVYVGNGRHIGHGSQPVDSITPGRPDFYLSFLD